VPIKASSARQIQSLLADLGAAETAVREAAIARLTVIGLRAVSQLIEVASVPDSSPAARAAAIRTLAAIGDPRSLDSILGAITSDDVLVACAAASAARGFVRGPCGARAVDQLTRAAMDTSRHEMVRVEALRALADLERSTVAPLLAALKNDSSDAVRAATKPGPAIDPAELLGRAADLGLPDDPDDLSGALVLAGAAMPLPPLLRLIERLREREQSEPAARRARWTRVRGRAHLALASRGSRLALYDLRESIESAGDGLPVEFVTAISSAGDTSCLEPITAAYSRAMSPDPSYGADRRLWRSQLSGAFRTIVKRERLTRRHAAIKKIGKRWGSALDQLWAD